MTGRAGRWWPVSNDPATAPVYNDFAEYDEWSLLEAILDKKDTRVPHMMKLLDGPFIRIGRSMGLLIVKMPVCVNDNEWVKVKRCRISSKERFRAWIRKMRPDVEQKLCAVEVDRYYRSSAGDQRV